ncbi:MAG: universal stress protein [Desulfobacteraceae bacterium]|nr:MAG: universal stress protein [Desulfobacteraceae bacterium]
MPVKTILWPTDLSEASLKAGGQVVTLAQNFGAEVILMYVAVDLCAYFPAYGNYPSPEHLNNFRDWEIERARKQLERICADELKACPFLKLRLVTGDPASEILKMIDQAGADLVVLSSRGQGARGGQVQELGRVAQSILQRSPVPVHVIK